MMPCSCLEGRNARIQVKGGRARASATRGAEVFLVGKPIQAVQYATVPGP